MMTDHVFLAHSFPVKCQNTVTLSSPEKHDKNSVETSVWRCETTLLETATSFPFQ